MRPENDQVWLQFGGSFSKARAYVTDYNPPVAFNARISCSAASSNLRVAPFT